MTILTAILYILATGLLLIGSSLSFEGKDADYFFISGTALFCLKSLIYLLNAIKKYNEHKSFYTDLGGEINF